MDLACDSSPLVQHIGPALLGPQPLMLRQQRGGLFGLDAGDSA
jgi:hypothetical protein